MWCISVAVIIMTPSKCDWFICWCSGWILIDRCGKHFGTVLNFLRDGTVPLPETRRELLELQKEAKYYLVEELVHTIETQLVNQTQVDPICKVPLITSQKEEQALVGSTGKVRLVTSIMIVRPVQCYSLQRIRCAVELGLLLFCATSTCCQRTVVVLCDWVSEWVVPRLHLDGWWTRNTFCRTWSLSNATFSFLITWRSSSPKSVAVYKISWKSDDFSLRYGDISIFKMAAVCHLGIVLPPYEAAHEVSVAGCSYLSNFIWIWYTYLKI